MPRRGDLVVPRAFTMRLLRRFAPRSDIPDFFSSLLAQAHAHDALEGVKKIRPPFYTVGQAPGVRGDLSDHSVAPYLANVGRRPVKSAKIHSPTWDAVLPGRAERRRPVPAIGCHRVALGGTVVCGLDAIPR